jgi:hypothetical protein
MLNSRYLSACMLISACTAACSGQPSADAKTRAYGEIADSVSIISASALEDLSYTVPEPDLIIGAGYHGKGDTLGIVAAIDAERGRIYILDTGRMQLRVVAPTGEAGRVIARAGRGPGELDHPRDIAVSHDSLFLLGTTVQVLDTNGRYLTASSPHLASVIPYSPTVHPTLAGVFLSRRILGEDKAKFRDDTISFYALRLPKTLRPMAKYVERQYDYGDDVEFPTVLTPGQIVIPSADGKLYSVMGDSLHVNITGPAGTLERTILGSMPRVAMKKTDIQDFERSVERKILEVMRVKLDMPDFQKNGPLPDRRPVIGQLLLDHNGSLLVQRLDDTPRPYNQYDNAGLMSWLLLRPDGTPVSRFRLPIGFEARRFADCKIYGVSQLQDGTPVVQRYEAPECRSVPALF